MLFLVLMVIGVTTGQDCAWDKDLNYPTYPPLLVDAAHQLVLPVLEGTKRMVRLSNGESVSVACSGSIITSLGKEATTATCAGGVSLSVGGTKYTLAQLGCSAAPKETLKTNIAKCGDNGIGDLQSIGFQILDVNDFFDLVLSCFDRSTETTLYTQHVVRGAHVTAKDIDGTRPSFKTSSGFFSVSMSSVYSQTNQLALMETLLGDPALAATIIDVPKQYYFAKGHMSPDADFVSTPEQDATYYYINAVPQWQAFNNGNWKYLEYATRDLGVAHASDLTVYSGGWNVLALNDINSNPVDIYLGLTEGKNVVPAPDVTWKVVHEPSTNKAVAVVGVNNPHLTKSPKTLCSDICSQITWLNFDFSNLVAGYTYCCTVSTLRAAIPHVPNLGNVGLLTS